MLINDTEFIFGVKSAIFSLWEDLKERVDWKKFNRINTDGKEKKFLDEYCKKFSKQFIEKYDHHPQIDTTDYILENFNSIRIKTNFSNICLIIPYEFVTIFEDGTESQIDINSLLLQSNDLIEIVYLIKDGLQNVRKSLRPKDIEILRALAHFSYPYYNKLPHTFYSFYVENLKKITDKIDKKMVKENILISISSTSAKICYD